jgi:hypothetical protein
MSDAEIAECFASVVADSASLDLAEMLGGNGVGSHFSQDQEK